MLRFLKNTWIDRSEENTNRLIQIDDEESLDEEYKYNYRDFETINWYKDITIPQKMYFPSLSIKSLFYAASGWIAVTLVGLITGVIALMLIVSTKLLFGLRLGFCPTNILYTELQCNWPFEMVLTINETLKQWTTYEQHFINIGYRNNIAHALSYMVYIVLSTLFATTAALISYNIGPYTVSSGIPEVETILKGFVIHGYLGFSTVIIKIVTVVLATASGLNVGFESSLVHIGAAIGNLVSRIFPKYRKSEAKKREGLQLVYLQRSMPLLAGSYLVLKRMSNYRLAHQMYGDCSYENSFNSGLWYYIKFNFCSNWKSNISLGDKVPEFRVLALTLFLKSIFLIISFSLKIPNGFIFPIMTIGAVFGRIVGNAMNYMLIIFPDWYFFKKYCNFQGNNSPCFDIALYAVIGSSAFLAGSTHITVTLVVIMVELIDGAGYIVPIMVSVLIAKSVSKFFSKLNMSTFYFTFSFEKSCILNDYPYIDLSASKIRFIGTAQDVIAAKKLRFQCIRRFSSNTDV
ncbi:hypothetical protein MXB_347 [Myxobolus squamalis]|nr:hypothetical protein MXB_347 [Myxobolus squamalis]